MDDTQTGADGGIPRVASHVSTDAVAIREERNYGMSQGSKESYTEKQKRQAEHIKKSYQKRGVSKKTAEARAWATVNKETGGGKKHTGKKG